MSRIVRFATRPLVAAGFTVAIVVGLSTPASAAPGHYSISATGGATFSLLTSHNLVNGTVDDQLFYLSTTKTGLHHLPFPIKAWGGSFKRIAISSNGNVQLGVASGGGTAAFSNDCLPSTTFTKPMIAPFWDDLFFDSNDTSHGFTEGVFLKTKGSAPHRKFTISWQGHQFNDSGALVQAQVIFKQRSQTITMIYGLNGGAQATIGTQSAQGNNSAQWSCNSGGNAVTSGQKLTFLHSS
jgi:hypothetical protein